MRFTAITLLFLMQLSFAAQEVRSIRAHRITTSPRIDGRIDDTCWVRAEIAGNFIQTSLQPGKPSAYPSEVKVLYDDDAVYIGAELYDVSGDSVLRELSVRDNEANSDQFGVGFDTYNDDINAFAFVVTSAGTQIDIRISNQGFDYNWNAVWQSAVRINERGWTVEMRIPYSALRFPKKDVQKWGFNIMRSIRRLREESYWNFVDPMIDAYVRQFGDLTGIENVEPPPRLSFSPYVAGIANYYGSSGTYNASGGMDVKYGLSDAFTLDMTLVPDFSQVQSDNQVLNLSPFEVQFQERRPFFTEGTELFNIGDLFYSRRVGGTPVDYWNAYDVAAKEGGRVVRNPTQTQLLNATKLSGRTPKKLGIGLFNAVANETEATIEAEDGSTKKVVTSPYTNYNIVALDQALPNNSSVNFVNTNVTRRGAYHNANVTHGGMQFNDKTNTYFVSGSAAVSQIVTGHLFDASQGYRTYFQAGKGGGNFRWSLFNNVRSDRFDPNDLGILQLGNNVESGLYMGYHIFKPFWKLNNMYNNMTIMYQRMYNPDAFWNFGIYGNHNTTFTKRFLTCGINHGIEPVVTYDYYEPRTFERFYRFPINYNIGGFMSSDYRKPFAFDVWGNYRVFEENARNNHEIYVAPRYRASNRLSFVYEVGREFRNDDIGFAASPADDEIIFSRRDVETVNNTFSTIYKFTNRMSLSFRVRHYWSKVEVMKFGELDDRGMLGETDYNVDHNRNFNAFNIDMVYFWQFAPGSELNLVWKQAVLSDARGALPANYFVNVDRGFNSLPTNMISLKVLYYIDFLTLRSAARRRNK
jgi:hypothetical protein